jgi:gluconolactonase
MVGTHQALCAGIDTRKLFVYTLFVFFCAVVSGSSQILVNKNIVRLDPAFDAIVKTDAKLEKLADTPGPGTREGPVWSRKGNFLLYSDMGAKGINKWSPGDGRVSVYQEKTDSDGLAIDRQGRVVWAARGPAGGEIVRLESDRSRTILVSDSADLPVKRPNDLVYKSDGALYFTDTDMGNRRVYLFKDEQLILLTKDLPYANGLAFSPGEKYLYINDSEKRIITRFDVRRDDTISNPKLIIDMAAGEAPCPFPCPVGYPDGMKVDQKGNIYSTGPGGIWIIAPDGKHLGTIPVPDHPANLGFGEADGKTLFIGCRPGLYRIRLKVAGIRP